MSEQTQLSIKLKTNLEMLRIQVCPSKPNYTLQYTKPIPKKTISKVGRMRPSDTSVVYFSVSGLMNPMQIQKSKPLRKYTCVYYTAQPYTCV